MASLKWRTRLTAGVFCSLLILIASQPASSAELLMVTLEHPPHNFSRDGEVSGASTEMLQYILTRMGHTPTFRVLPWKRAQKMIEDGLADGIYSYTQTPQRLKAAYFSHPISFTSDVLFKRQGDDFRWDTFSDLGPYRVGASGGYNYPEEFLESAKKGEFKLQLISSNDPNKKNLRKLKSGRIDFFICNPDVCRFIIKSNTPEFDTIDFIDKPLAPLRSFHVGFSKKVENSNQIRDEFNRQLDILIENGGLRQIYDKYGMKPDYGKLGSKGISFMDKNAE